MPALRSQGSSLRCRPRRSVPCESLLGAAAQEQLAAGGSFSRSREGAAMPWSPRGQGDASHPHRATCGEPQGSEARARGTPRGPSRLAPLAGTPAGRGGALLVNRLKGAVRTRGDSRKLTHTDRRWPGTPTSPERRAPPEATGGPRALPRRSHGALDTQHGSCRPHARRVLAGAAAVSRGSTRRSAPPGRQRRRAGPSPPLSQAAGVGPGPPPHGTAPAAGTQTRVPGEAGESRLTESSWNDEN